MMDQGKQQNRIKSFFLSISIVICAFGSLKGQVAIQHIQLLSETPLIENLHFYFDQNSQHTSFNDQSTQMDQPSFVMVNPSKHLPFFCAIEVKADVKTKIPVRVRLGSVSYVDALENKYQGHEWITSNRTRTQPQLSVPR